MCTTSKKTIIFRRNAVYMDFQSRTVQVQKSVRISAACASRLLFSLILSLSLAFSRSCVLSTAAPHRCLFARCSRAFPPEYINAHISICFAAMKTCCCCSPLLVEMSLLVLLILSPRLLLKALSVPPSSVSLPLLLYYHLLPSIHLQRSLRV